MKGLQFFVTFLQMAPAIIGLVKQVETAMPGNGQGKQKLDLVLQTVNTAVGASTEVMAAVAGHDLIGAVTTLVNGTVSTMNASGEFTKTK